MTFTNDETGETIPSYSPEEWRAMYVPAYLPAAPPVDTRELMDGHRTGGLVDLVRHVAGDVAWWVRWVVENGPEIPFPPAPRRRSRPGRTAEEKARTRVVVAAQTWLALCLLVQLTLALVARIL